MHFSSALVHQTHNISFASQKRFDGKLHTKVRIINRKHYDSVLELTIVNKRMFRTILPTFFRCDFITLTSNSGYKFFLMFHGLTVFLRKWFILCKGCDVVTTSLHSYMDSAKPIATLLTTRQSVVHLKTISHQRKYMQLDRLDYICPYRRTVQSYNCQTACGLKLLSIICSHTRCNLWFKVIHRFD